MTIYRYDGTFNGLLCLILKVARDGKEPEGILGPGDGQEILFPAEEIRTDEASAQNVFRALKERTSARTLSEAYHAFLSESPGMDVCVLRYLALAWREGPGIGRRLADEPVASVHETARRVAGERHRFLGLVRFRDTGQVLYAPIEPDFNILPLLGGHFSARLPLERFVIHDVRRKEAVLGYGGTWALSSFDPRPPVRDTEDDIRVRELFRSYFRSTAIAFRKNPELQRSHLPKKYRKWLVELDD